MTRKEVEQHILSLPNTFLDYPFGEEVAVYKIGSSEKASEGKMFALISENKTPINISLKCDPQLASLLRERYETIMPGYHLNKKHWNTLVLTGQLPWEEVQALIRHSYDLVSSATNQH